jgi:benzil reductase ((S)-benzoin forming)
LDYYYVTGTSRGLGAALTEELLQDAGTTVIGVGRSAGPTTHERYRHLALDLTDLDAVSAFRFEAHADAERIVLVNNAASLFLKRVGDIEPAAIVDNFNINIVAPTLLMNAFVAAYRDAPVELVICNLTSIASTEAIDAAALYGGPKAALELVTRTVAEEARLTNRPHLHAFCIDPGSMDTDMQTYLRSFDPSEWGRAEFVRQRYEQGLVLSPATVASAIMRVLREPKLAPGAVFAWMEIPVE